MVTDANALETALRKKHYDVVIAAFAAADTVATATADAGAAGKTTLLPVVTRSDRNSPQVRSRFGAFLVDGARLGQYLRMIGKALPANAL